MTSFRPAGILLMLAFALDGATGAVKAPDVVTVGTYLNQIFGVDLKNNSFNVDFYVWLRWTNDALKPMDSIQLVNGRITSKTAVTVKKVGGMNVASARIVATITKFWVMDRFPMDHHELTIELEDGAQGAGGIVYQADAASSGLADGVQVPGWRIANTQARIVPHFYKVQLQQSSSSDSGGTSQPGNEGVSFSRYVFSTFIVRPGYGRFFKIFLGLFVAVTVAHLAFFVRPKDVGPRVSLGVGAVFAVAASSFAINSMLPESANLTMADKLIMSALSCVAVSVLGTIFALRLTYRGKDAAAVKFDTICGRYLPLVYLALFAYAILA